MSVAVPENVVTYRQILDGLVVRAPIPDENGNRKEICCYSREEQLDQKPLIHVPMYYAVYQLQRTDNGSLLTHERRHPVFEGKLREEQTNIVNECLSSLNERGTCFVSLHCGGGKSCVSVYLSCVTGMLTLFLVHRVHMANQVEQEILKFCPTARVKQWSTKCKPGSFNRGEVDFVVASVQSIWKADPELLDSFGTVIVDEAHVVCTQNMLSALYVLHPKYLIGLSATPIRADGMHTVLDLYFGPDRIGGRKGKMDNIVAITAAGVGPVAIASRGGPSSLSFIPKAEITVTMFKPHLVYKVSTGMVPDILPIETGPRAGRPDWNSAMDWEAHHEPRHVLVVDLVCHFAERNILVLCKRKNHVESLVRLLRLRGEHVDTMYSTQKSFNHEARVLVGTIAKVGYGFNHPKLDCLLLAAADSEIIFSQFHGRVFRKLDVEAIVIDVVDDHNCMRKHWGLRRKYYLNSGGKIKNLSIPPSGLPPL